MKNYNGMITIDETKDKYIFWDLDGVLAPYRFNGHITDPTGKTQNGQSDEEILNGCFLYRKPSKHMQNVVNTCKSKKNILMGHCWNEKEKADKEKWLDRYYPSIKERFLIDIEKSKGKTILDYCLNNNINLKDVIFVDDSFTILRDAEKYGINVYHISSFLDWNE